MNYWKVLGGVAAGVGAVVALPVAGPIGAVTALGAAIAGTLGGVAGAAVAMSDEEDKDAARREGEQAATAKYEERVKKLTAAFNKALDRSKDDKSYFAILIALFAIGMATANADGTVSEEEVADLEQFTMGVSSSVVPNYVKEEFEKLKKNPPNLNTAMEYVNKTVNPDMKIFEEVIQLISASDGTVSEEEIAFLAAFKAKAAA